MINQQDMTGGTLINHIEQNTMIKEKIFLTLINIIVITLCLCLFIKLIVIWALVLKYSCDVTTTFSSSGLKPCFIIDNWIHMFLNLNWSHIHTYTHTYIHIHTHIHSMYYTEKSSLLRNTSFMSTVYHFSSVSFFLQQVWQKVKSQTVFQA